MTNSEDYSDDRDNPVRRERVWDLPLRLFHWCLTIAVSVSIYTGLTGGFKEMDYHMWSGYTIITLLTFRVGWGFFGSHHARFMSFISLPGAFTYLRQLLQKSAPVVTGHNPLGGLSIVAMLIAFSVQAGTGLFANDDIMIEGPLAYMVSEDTSDTLTAIHHFNIWIIYILLGMHLTAIAGYELLGRQRLILAMITGKKRITDDSEVGAPTKPLTELLIAMVLLGIAGGFTYYLVKVLA